MFVNEKELVENWFLIYKKDLGLNILSENYEEEIILQILFIQRT